MTSARKAAVLAVALGVLVIPRAASAHAAFVSSDPEPGERLSSAPGFVRISFSEPLILKLSRATVEDPTGRSFPTIARTERTLNVRLETNAPGIYEVRWVTVSPLDGHTLRGAFRFGVGVTPADGESSASTSPRILDLVLAVGRALEYAGLLAAGGMILLIALARRRPRIDWVRPRLRLPLVCALVGGLAVVAGEAAAAAGSFRPQAFADFFTSGTAGWARLTRVAAEASALALSLAGARWAWPALVLALAALAAAGHAAALRPAWWGVAVDAAHLALASLWAGGILALATIRPPQGWRGPEGTKLLARFTPVALYAFSFTVATGILRASQELSGWADFVTSSYGRVLALKILGVMAMVPLSMRAYRRVSDTVRGEAVLAVAVIGAAALLAAYPLPPGRAQEAEGVATQATGSERAVPKGGDVTLGGSAGRTLVGLTLRPGSPGRNEALVFLLPLSGAESARDVGVAIKIGRRELEARSCGTTCRRAVLTLRGGERLHVAVGGPEGGSTVFDVPSLPAPGGGKVVAEATARMRRLETLRVSETLGPADPIVRTEYTFQAPDRMRIEASTRYRTVAIGSTQYQQGRAQEQWTVSKDVPPIDAPLLTWLGFEVVAPHIVGADRIEGVETTIVSFFTGDVSNPIWFGLWVDPQLIVRRMQMRAPGHFMNQRLYDFDAPVSIQAPR
ncbi:MAG: copper resistance CopC/CopD family protein [Actinomycetota bacterium]